MHSDTLSRISKLFVDRDDQLVEEAEARRKAHRVCIVCGPELGHSGSMQAALLTAASTAARCFPNAVEVVLPNTEAVLDKLGWHQSIGEALTAPHIGVQLVGRPSDESSLIGIGSTEDVVPTVRATFDRWAGGVVPGDSGTRLKERDGNPLAGMLCGALAVSEIFLRFARIQVEATRREVGLSLWNPARQWATSGDSEPDLEELPAEFWLLGLGHLGQAYSFALSLLPFADRRKVNILLQDHDRIVPANVETGIVCSTHDVERFKARTVTAWLEARGFRPRIVERRFDSMTRVEKGEPRLALCGFDGGGPRHLLDLASIGFERIVEAGLGGRADNFESMSIHSLPHSQLSAAKLWPEGEASTAEERAKELAGSRRAYSEVERKRGCGHLELAGRSVGVPFVGAVAASLVLSEALRMVHPGQRFDLLELRLGDPSAMITRPVETGYWGEATPILSVQAAYRQ